MKSSEQSNGQTVVHPSALKAQLPSGILAVRLGSGANCSSIGSVIDLLFGSMVLASAVYASIAIVLHKEEVLSEEESKNESLHQ